MRRVFDVTTRALCETAGSISKTYGDLINLSRSHAVMNGGSRSAYHFLLPNITPNGTSAVSGSCGITHQDA
jgi:hypothetical protein